MASKRQNLSVSNTLRQALHQSEVSLYALAKQASMPYSVLWRFRSGERQITSATLDRLSEALGYRLVKG